MAYTTKSLRSEKRQLRERMQAAGLGCCPIAAEFARVYQLRPRAAWREAHGWSLQETADRINGYRGDTGLDPAGQCGMTSAHLCEYENWPGHGNKPTGRKPSLFLLAVLAGVYGCDVHDLLDLADRRHLPADSLLVIDSYMPALARQPRSGELAERPGETDAFPALQATDVTGPFTLGIGNSQETDDPVRRRDFVGLASASLLGSVLDADPGRPALDAEPLAAVLTGHAQDISLPPADSRPDIAELSAAVTRALRHYQACRYKTLISQLPQLLTRLQLAATTMEGEARRSTLTLTAETCHVAAGLLLKLGDQGLAHLAADRSMRAALASQDPITVGASARIITHALMNGKHLASAVSTATRHAERLDREVSSHTPESLSVYGSLLLRGAVAAAQNDQRGTALQLLDEADSAGSRVGADGNLRWTAFGPANARLHRVNIAVRLGDAGTAIDVARTIDLSTIAVTERRASLLIDTARAYLQWGRHEKAYIALRAAEHIAHEEVAGRPSVHRVVRQLLATAPPAVRRDAARFATGIGVTP